MTPDSTLAVTNTCPENGVHLNPHRATAKPLAELGDPAVQHVRSLLEGEWSPESQHSDDI